MIERSAEARRELPLSHAVPKTLGAVGFRLWNSLRSWPSPLPPMIFSIDLTACQMPEDTDHGRGRR